MQRSTFNTPGHVHSVPDGDSKLVEQGVQMKDRVKEF